MPEELINNKGSVSLNLASEQLRVFIAWQMAAVDERYLVRAVTRPHVTLVMGVDPDIDIDAVRAAIRDQGAVSATTSEFAVFKDTHPGEDAIVMLLHSPEVVKMHDSLERAFGASRSQYAFRPHLTLAYVKSGSHDFLNGLNTESVALFFDEVRVRNDNAHDDDTFPLNYEEDDDDD